MSTRARLGIDITATNKTAAAFASVQKSVAGIHSSMQSLKFLMAGFVTGNFLEGMVRSFVEVSKQTAPVKKAIENLGRAWYGFAQQVGNSGMNQALINFANRMSAMVLGTDQLAKSIGGFMSGAINAMAMTFEGVGRAIAFAYDNAVILGRLLASFAIALFARQVMGVAIGFVYFAKAVRETGIIMATFRAISGSSLYVFLALAAGVAYATDSIDTLKSGIETLWGKVKEVFPQIADTGKSMAEAFGFNLDALSSDLLNGTELIAKLGSIEMPALATSAAATMGKVNNLATATRDNLGAAFKDTAAESNVFLESLTQIGDTISSGLSNALAGLISGTMTVKNAFASMAQSIIQTLSDLAAQLAINAGLKLLMSLLNYGVSPSQQGGGFFGTMLSSFAGGFATGGTLGAGKWGFAGEAGPEIVQGPARITPMSGGMNVTVNNYAGADVRTRRGADGAMQIDILKAEIAKDLARGGNIISQAVERGYGLRRAGR